MEELTYINLDNVCKIKLYKNRIYYSFKRKRINFLFRFIFKKLNIDYPEYYFYSYLHDIIVFENKYSFIIKLIFMGYHDNIIQVDKNTIPKGKAIYWHDGKNVYFKPHIEISLNNKYVETKYFDSVEELEAFRNNYFNDRKYIQIIDGE